MLTEGTVAPEIVLKDKNSNEVKLSDFKGQKVVVYFYPKDNTPGCTRQACAFSNNFSKFEELNVKVIGISKDSEASHIRFADKYDLPFVLLSDPELKAIKDYDVWQEKRCTAKLLSALCEAHI